MLFSAGFILTKVKAIALLAQQPVAPRTLAQAEGTVLPPLPRAPAHKGATVRRGWGDGRRTAAHAVIREYRNGRDLTDTPRNVKVIDLFGLSAEVARKMYPRDLPTPD